MEKKNKKQALLAASVAGLLAVTGAVMLLPAAAHAEEVPCYGANACKGTGACHGEKNGCAGQNACKGQGYLKVESKDACLAMQGGSLTPPAKV